MYVDDATTDDVIRALCGRAAAALAAAAAPGASRDALRDASLALEASLHALSAAAKQHGVRGSPSLADAISHVLPAAANLASELARAAEGLGRGLLCTVLVLVGAFAAWLGGGGPDRAAAVGAILPVVLSSIAVPEEDATGAWPMRSQAEHAG